MPRLLGSPRSFGADRRRPTLLAYLIDLQERLTDEDIRMFCKQIGRLFARAAAACDCPMCRLPATRPEFWKAKIAGNRRRDQRAAGELFGDGWRVLVVWECSLRGPTRLADNDVLARIAAFLQSNRSAECDIEGKWR